MGQGLGGTRHQLPLSKARPANITLFPRSLYDSTAELQPVQDAPCSPKSRGFTRILSYKPGCPPAWLTLASSLTGGPSPRPPHRKS